ncbi:MAG: hypothetical protein OJF52_003482 [Nitrospira sp.]|jgi:hypothetical protein|nr:MAG: hypothetical protein OJF52_003482 [Nitrospira sp.]
MNICKGVILAAGLTLLLTGCVSTGDESIRERSEDWPPLTMTKAELVRELGPPSTRTVSVEEGKTRETLSWAYAEAQANPAAFIPLVGLAVVATGNGSEGEVRALAVTFNDEGRMIGRTWSRHPIGSRKNDTASDDPSPAGKPHYDPTAAGGQ